MQGTHAPYGTPAGEGSDATFSIDFSSMAFDEFLFSSGDCSLWLIATRDSVNGETYSNAYRPILKSSSSVAPYEARWYNRANTREDPWLSTTDHAGAVDNGQIVYGGNSYSNSRHTRLLRERNGANVWVRSADHGAPPSPPREPYVPVTCRFSADNAALNVYFDGEEVTERVSGGLDDWRQVKTLQFDAPIARDATLAIRAKDAGYNGDYNRAAGLLLACTSLDAVWGGLRSHQESNSAWKLDGRSTDTPPPAAGVTSTGTLPRQLRSWLVKHAPLLKPRPHLRHS